MKTNVLIKQPRLTHEGGKAKPITPEQELRRSVMACLLWENTFYECGEDIAARISRLSQDVPLEKLSQISIEARSQMNLRHAPLLLVREMARHPQLKKSPSLVSKTLKEVIQRADELAEFLAIYWRDGKTPLSAQVKKGLAAAFGKFNEYHLAKYDREGTVRLRDALFLSHAKPESQEREDLYKRLVNGKLETPDTWEVALSGGEDKRDAWERLMVEKKLGVMAFLRNLRNMDAAKVSDSLINAYADSLRTDRVLPFRFIAAARAVPRFEPMLERLMLKQEHEKLDGETVLMVDVSSSMDTAMSQKSDLQRIDAACGLAILLREMADSLRVYSFSNHLVEVPPRRGFALRDAIMGSQHHSGTYLGKAVTDVMQRHPGSRLIVISDEQSADRVPDPSGRAYMINVAAYQNGVGYGAWNHIDGFSETIVKWVREFER